MLEGYYYIKVIPREDSGLLNGQGSVIARGRATEDIEDGTDGSLWD